MVGGEGVGGLVVKVTSTAGLCTQLPGSSHAWDGSARLGLHTGSGKGEPEDNSAGAGGGEDSEDTEAGLLENPGTRWLPPSGKSGGADREARTPRTSWQTVPTGEQAPNTALRAQSGPTYTGRILSRPQGLLTAGPRALRAGRAQIRGAGARRGWDLCARAASSGYKHCKQAPRLDTPPTSSRASWPLAFYPRPRLGSKWTPTAPAPLVRNPWLWALDARFSAQDTVSLG